MDKCAADRLPLFSSQELFRVMDTLADAVVCVNMNLRLVHINPTAADFFSLDRDKLADYDLFTILPEKYHAIHERFLRRCQGDDPPELRGRVFRLKLKYRHHQAAPWDSRSIGGEPAVQVPVTLSLSSVPTESGRIFAMIIRRRISVGPANSNILKDDQITITLSSVSHEIRNPLVAIGGFARRIARDAGLSEKSRHHLAVIQEEVERLERLVNGLKDLAKADSYRFEYVDLRDVLLHVGAIMRQQASQEAKNLHLELIPGLPKLLMDKDRVSQVIINLIRNALQACPAGGEVRLQAGMALKSDYIRIAVADNGQGIAPEHLSKMFQPFFTTKKGGSGLGLAVSRRIIEDHGGSLEINSVFTKGTTVNILLPL